MFNFPVNKPSEVSDVIPPQRADYREVQYRHRNNIAEEHRHDTRGEVNQKCEEPIPSRIQLDLNT